MTFSSVADIVVVGKRCLKLCSPRVVVWSESQALFTTNSDIPEQFSALAEPTNQRRGDDVDSMDTGNKNAVKSANSSAQSHLNRGDGTGTGRMRRPADAALLSCFRTCPALRSAERAESDWILENFAESRSDFPEQPARLSRFPQATGEKLRTSTPGFAPRPYSLLSPHHSLFIAARTKSLPPSAPQSSQSETFARLHWPEIPRLLPDHQSPCNSTR